MELLGVKMKLIALRYMFVGKNDFGRPFGTPLPVNERQEAVHPKEKSGTNGTFEFEIYDRMEIRTHDRGDDPERQSKAFYHICFRLDEVSDDEKSGYVVELVPDRGKPLEYDAENDLWYQRTMFGDDGRPVADDLNHGGSITTAGLLCVNVRKRNGRKIIISKKIEVLPSLIDKAGYKTMLDRLLSINERLIVSGNSQVGIGNSEKSSESGDSTEDWDYKLWNKLKAQLGVIMKTPPDLLRKRYEHIPKERNRHFDSRVMRSICKNEGSRSIDGVSFVGDNDTYENRAIKFILSRLGRRLPYEDTADTDIEAGIRKDVGDKFYSLLQKPMPVCSTFTKSTRKNGRLYIRRNVQGNIRVKVRYENACITVSTGSAPFMAKNSVYDFEMKTMYANVALAFLEWIARICSDIRRKVVPYGSTINDLWKADIKVESCKVIFDERADISPITASWDAGIKADTPKKWNHYMTFETFWKNVSEINNKYAGIIDIYYSEYNSVCLALSRHDLYVHRNAERQKKRKFNDALKGMNAVLSTKWFRGITDLPQIELPLRRTPKFLFNKYYSAVYELLQEYLNIHPLITTDFEENSFGLKETWQIYEYWVFCEILQRFHNLGFKAEQDGIDKIKKSFASFVHSNDKPEGFSVSLSRKYIINNEEKAVNILLGYNVFIGKKEKGLYLTPDVFIRVTHEDAYHWYFIDMKYKKYHTDGDKSAGCLELDDEVRNVAVDKYITKMGDIDFSNIKSDDNKKNLILGSYLIAARIDEKEKEIATNDRLNGGERRINHEFGAIEFRPGYEEELTTLIQLIFEYKENESDLGNYGSESKKRPDSLYLCWDSSMDHNCLPNPRIDTEKTKSGYNKYYIICKCGAMRFENYCCYDKRGILKHDRGNYHKRAEEIGTAVSDNQRWNFVCPKCGGSL